MSGLMALTTRGCGRLFGLRQAAGLGLGSGFVGVWPIEPHAADSAALRVDLGADHVPPLTEVKHAVMKLGRPALRRDADATASFVPHGLSLSAAALVQTGPSPRSPRIRQR